MMNKTNTTPRTAAQRPVLHYLGSKWIIAPWVIEHFPPHNVYVEPFGGGASVLLRKEPSPVEIYNDLDSSVVNFWRVLRERPDELITIIKRTAWAREEYLLAWEPTDDPLEFARRVFVRTWMSFSGEPDHIATWRAAKRKAHGQSVVQWGSEERLLAVAARWRSVQIEHDNALTVIRRFDTDVALFYCDPPYVHSTRTSKNGYKYEMSDDAHLELLDLLNSIKGKAMVSGYPNDLYKKHLPAKRWRCVQREGRTRDPRRPSTEMLWIKK